ncbi:Transposase [Phytophthora palmivora]|uniref:Transposase n=1 Tax=Phytophthora palmivora TaxID=4796 RepID=A0A2P4YVP2_9STRA|nr:Transposase [Phytophthora palmivora]
MWVIWENGWYGAFRNERVAGAFVLTVVESSIIKNDCGQGDEETSADPAREGENSRSVRRRPEHLLSSSKDRTLHAYGQACHVGSPASSPKSTPPGPAPALTERQTRRLVRAAAKGDSPASQLKSELQLSVSVRTIQRTLAKVDWLVYTKMVNTLPLTAKDMKTRKEWASAMLAPGPSGTPFSFLMKRSGTLTDPMAFITIGATCAKSLATRSDGRPVVGRQNSDDYVYTVSEFLLPSAHLTYGTDFIYQQDNASIHVSKRSTGFFSEQDISSPDLNPIENLWSILSRKVYANGRQFESVQELKTALFEAWEAVPLALLLSLVESMPRRCVEVLAKNGNKTHY